VKRKRLVIIIVSFFAVVILGALVWPREREPEYRGHKLSYWLDRSMDPDFHTEGEAAIGKIGTNAVMYLTKMLLYEPSSLSRELLDLTDRLPDNLQGPCRRLFVSNHDLHEREQLAIEGFRILGPVARGAIPNLVRCLVTHARKDERPVLIALGCIGEESLPPIVSAMTNLDNPKSLRAEAALWIMGLRMINSFTASNLVHCAQAKEPEIALNAAYALASQSKEPNIVLPVLIAHAHDTNSLTRFSVIEAIGEYGEKAQPAVPLLVKLLSDPEEYVRSEATNSLFNIDKTALPEGTVIPVRID
jgi:hypothetical protein